MPRTDYYHDPNAPTPNSLVVATMAFVQDSDGRLLMIERTDNALWSLPGGAQDLGESIVEGAIREVREETGILIEITGLVGIYSDPGHVIAYADGEVRQEFSVCFRGRPTGGKLVASHESKRARWIETSELDHLPIHPAVRLRISHGLEHSSRPYLG